MTTQGSPESPPDNLIVVENWPVKAKPKPKSKTQLAGWLVLVFLIIVTIATLGKLLPLAIGTTEGREAKVYPDSLPSQELAVPEQELVSLRPSIPEPPTPVPAIPVEKLEEELNQFIETGTGEVEAQQTASYFAQTYQDLAVRKAVELLGQLSSYESLNPEVERIAKVTLWLCPVLETDVQNQIHRIAQEEAARVAQASAKPIPETEEVPPETQIPPLLILTEVGLSSRLGYDPDQKKIFAVQMANNQWKILQIRKIGHLKLFTLQQVYSETQSPIVLWLGAPIGQYEVGQIVEGIELPFP